MEVADTTTGNMFEAIPEVLLHNILALCGPMYEIRASASCQLLRKIHTEIKNQNKHLTSFATTVNGSTADNTPLFPQNVKKLQLTLPRTATFSEAARIYRELGVRIKNSSDLGVEHLSSVQELAIAHQTPAAGDLILAAQQSLQQMLYLLPCLHTLWVGTLHGSQLLLSCKDLHALPSIYRVSLALMPHPEQLVRFPTLLPNLDTLCVSVKGPMEAAWLQPLSQLSQLSHLSLDLDHSGKSILPDMQEITSLRHLKLSNADMDKLSSISSISRLTQLHSLSLCNVLISCLEDLVPLAVLNVSFLTLHSVYVSEGAKAWDADTVQQPQGPHWPKLTHVYVKEPVSNRVLQAMLLPHPTDTGLKMKTAAFDDFVNQYNHSMLPQPNSRPRNVTAECPF